MKHDKYRIKKDDRVMVITGREKGRIGKILSVLPKRGGAIVESVNMVKRHSRPTSHAPQGGIIEKEAPLPLSNLMLVCGKCGETVRVGRKVLEDGQRARYCKKCGEMAE